MYEMVYSDRAVLDLLRVRFPSALFEDASDEFRPHRFCIEVDVTKEEFYLFALREGFALACFGFQVMLQDPSQREAVKSLMKAAKE